jgi:hypothetical protein
MKTPKKVIEKILLQLMFVTFILAVLMLAVIPVSAAPPPVGCYAGSFCDQDSDEYIRDHKKCTECGGEVKDCDDSVTDPTNTCDGDPSDGGEGLIVYTAVLTGAFEFNTVVTPNKRKSSLHSNENVDMVRPGFDLAADPPIMCKDILVTETSEECQTWNHVFNTCPLLLTKDSVQGFDVGADDWSIQRPGGVYVQFNDILFTDAEVTVALYGDKSVNTDPFLPVPGEVSGDTEMSVVILDRFATWGKSLPGADGPIMGCDLFEKLPLGYDNGPTFKAIPSTLVITATRL